MKRIKTVTLILIIITFMIGCKTMLGGPNEIIDYDTSNNPINSTIKSNILHGGFGKAQLKWEDTYEYDEKGRIIKESYKSKDRFENIKSYIYMYDYGKNDNIVKEIQEYKEDNELKEKAIYNRKYNDNDLMIKYHYIHEWYDNRKNEIIIEDKEEYIFEYEDFGYVVAPKSFKRSLNKDESLNEVVNFKWRQYDEIDLSNDINIDIKLSESNRKVIARYWGFLGVDFEDDSSFLLSNHISSFNHFNDEKNPFLNPYYNENKQFIYSTLKIGYGNIVLEEINMLTNDPDYLYFYLYKPKPYTAYDDIYTNEVQYNFKWDIINNQLCLKEYLYKGKHDFLDYKNYELDIYFDYDNKGRKTSEEWFYLNDDIKKRGKETEKVKIFDQKLTY